MLEHKEERWREEENNEGQGRGDGAETELPWKGEISLALVTTDHKNTIGRKEEMKRREGGRLVPLQEQQNIRKKEEWDGEREGILVV